MGKKRIGSYQKPLRISVVPRSQVTIAEGEEKAKNPMSQMQKKCKSQENMGNQKK